MWLILCLSLIFTSGNSVGAEPVELFDTDEERVVQTFPNSDEFQETAKTLLDSVNGRVAELNPSLEHAMIVKIPLVPPRKLLNRSASIDATVGQMFVVMPKKGERKPWMILLTQNDETLVVEFGGEVVRLKKLVGL
jgi:hypothetical protein